MSEQVQSTPEVQAARAAQPAAVRKKPRRKRHILRKLLIMLVVLLVIAGGVLYAVESLRQEYTITYTSYTASTGSISNALSFSGSLNLINSTTHTATDDGTVRAVYVGVGDQVKKGDKLIRLSNGETVTADFDGRVNALKVEAGDEVAAGTSLIQVADFTNMKVSIRVDEYDIADVSIGQKCTVTATATEQEFESTIQEIDYISASSGNVAYYTATAYVQVGEGIYPGMQVTISIPQEEAENVVILKMDALSFDASNSAFVYMYNEENVLEQVPVEVGVSNGNYVEIKSGLKAGDQVYVETETEAAASGLQSMLSGIFGGQQIMPGAGGYGGMGGGRGGSGGMDFSNFTMPDGGNFTRPGGSGSGGSGGFGGGGR